MQVLVSKLSQEHFESQQNRVGWGNVVLSLSQATEASNNAASSSALPSALLYNTSEPDFLNVY